jgi:N-carbamoylputrescine amidase
MSELTVAALQLAFSDDVGENIAAVSELVREAAGKGAKLILPPELFEGHYFCRTQDEGHFAKALPTDEHPVVLAMRQLAAELEVYIPTSFFEAEGHHHYNSLAMIDDKGAVMGVYRKSHIPDGPAIPRNSISARAIPASRPSARLTGKSARRSAGTNGIRKPRAR